MKVLHVINSPLPGGAESLLVNSLSSKGLSEYTENHFAYFMGSSYLLDKLDKRVQVHFLNYKGKSDIFRLIKDLRALISNNKFDIVHSHLNPAGLYTHLACTKNVTHVHTVHTTYSADSETAKMKLLAEKYFYFKRERINLIFLSDFTKQDFLKCIRFKGRCFVLNNFVSDEYFIASQKNQHLENEGLNLIAVGSLKALKNFEYLLEIFRHLKNYNISLDIYGGGNKLQYEKFIVENQLKIRMMGHSQQLKNIISSYDLFIMPSKFEGFPLSVFEAMAAGVPLMLSNIESLNSIVKDNAIYFELNDAKKVAIQLIDIFKNKKCINNMAVKARIYAEQNATRDIYIKKLLAIYNSLTKG